MQNLISTIVISVFATLLVLLVSLPAAYYTARFRFPGRMVFLFLVIVTQMLQPAVLTSGPVPAVRDARARPTRGSR